MFYGGEKKLIIMSANRATSLMLFREIAWTIESTPELKAMTKAIRYANGGERIELLNGATLDVISDNSSSPRGRTADFLWIDEIREISEDGYKAAVPVTRARANSQTFLTSNAGDHFSSVLNGLVERAKDYPPETFGYYEYSAPQYCKIDITLDSFWRDAVAPSNPALSFTITKESIEEAIATNPIEQTRTETLCQWIDSLQSPWPHGVLEETSDNTLQMTVGAYTVFGFDVSPSRRNASLVAGQLLPDGRIGIGILETYSSQVAIDSIDWFERLVYEQICREAGIASIGDISHGRGYNLAFGWFQRLTRELDELILSRGMGVFLIAHAEPVRFEDPETAGYDRWQPKLQNQVLRHLREWCDEIFFAAEKVMTTKEEGRMGRDIHKAKKVGQRILRTTGKPSAVAGNRTSSMTIWTLPIS